MSVIHYQKHLFTTSHKKKELSNCIKVHYKTLLYTKAIKHQEKPDFMQIPAIYYEHKINVLVWLNVQDQYSAEHKHFLNFVLNIKDSLIFHCMCPKELRF